MGTIICQGKSGHMIGDDDLEFLMNDSHAIIAPCHTITEHQIVPMM